MKPRIIYTSIFGGYDTLQPIKVPDGWKALCFTDSDIVAKGWEIVHTKAEPKIFRKIKTCPHLYLPEHELSIWCDGNIIPQMPLNHLVNGKSGYWLMMHPHRQCIYTEGQRCKELRKDDDATIDAQMARYRKEKYPEKNGLVATGVLIRTSGYEKFSEDWYSEIEKGSVRDQLSFNYVAHKHRLHFKLFPFLQGFKRLVHTGKK